MDASFKPREFCFPNAEQLLSQEHACLKTIESELPIGLPPRYLGNESDFVKSILNTKLGKFDERIQCIPVSYRNVRRLGRTGVISGEDPNVYFKILVEYIVFQPVTGSKVLARVEKLSKSHIGLLVHQWFNASIARSTLEKGTDLSVGDEVVIEILNQSVCRRLLSLVCKLDSIVKKAPAAVVMNTSSTGKHKSFNEDETENETLPSKGKNNSIGSDSGIEHEKANPELQSNTEVKLKSKKRKKRPHDADHLSESEELSKPKKKKTKLSDESITEVSILNSTVDTLNSSHVINGDMDVVTPSLSKKSKKHKKSKRESYSGDEASLEHSLKKHKKRHNKDIVSQDSVISTDVVELDDTFSSVKKSKKKKKHKE